MHHMFNLIGYGMGWFALLFAIACGITLLAMGISSLLRQRRHHYVGSDLHVRHVRHA